MSILARVLSVHALENRLSITHNVLRLILFVCPNALPRRASSNLSTVVLSHLHGDHFDDLVAERLRRNIPIISTPHACENLEPQGFTSLYPLQTWEKITIQKGEDSITITSMPGKHTLGVIESADSVLHAIPPVMGSLIEFKREDGSLYNLYISGDTLYYDELKARPSLSLFFSPSTMSCL